MDGISTTPTRSLIRRAIFGQTGPPTRIDCLALLWEYKRKVSFPGTQRYISLLRNRTRSRQPCAVANLRSNLLSCNSVSWEDSV